MTERRRCALQCAGFAGLVLAASQGCGGEAALERPLSGVLITLDTTQSAALGAYGAGSDATPHLDALAREGLVFGQARAVAPLTLPSHASMLTGLYPPRHSVRDNGLAALPRAATTLAERARERGFDTAAFVAAVVLGSPWGLAQGFDHYDEVLQGGAGMATSHMNERRAGDVSRAAIQWLETRDPERPFLMWVHYFDPHEPYDPPREFIPPGTAPTDKRALYAAEVRAMDAAIGELIDALDERWGFENLFVTVVADHGEGFGIHGEETHSVLVYEELIHVPLLVREPAPRGEGGAAAGAVDDRIASIADVYPTFLDALGLGAPGDIDGVSLLTSDPDPDRGAYFESMTGYLAYGWSPLVGWVDRMGKYTFATTPELYDLETDPDERRNRAQEDPAAVGRYQRALAELSARSVLERGEDETVDENARSGIDDLGYANVAGGDVELPGLLEKTGWPHPRERLSELQAFYEATLRFNEAFPRRDRAGIEAALEQMIGIVDSNPNNVYALNVLSTFLYQLGNYPEALRRLRQIPPHGVDRLNVQDMLGHCLEALSQLEQALGHFQRANQLKPNDEHQIGDVLRVLRKLGREDEAARLESRSQ